MSYETVQSSGHVPMF